MIVFQSLKQIVLNFSHRKELVAHSFFSTLATGHFSGKLFVEGHSSCHTGSNDTSPEFVSCQEAEKKGCHTHTHTHTE